MGPVRLYLRAGGSLWVDGLLLIGATALIAGLISLGREWAGPLTTVAEIDLSFRSLPGYTLLSLSRGVAAYLLSLAFTIVCGGAAARSRRVERVVIPILDVLQGIPVLSFLPGLVIGLVGLFPRSNVGLELACVLAIFTGQVWNMTFSFYASVRAIPGELSEAARLYRLSRWQRLTTLELPSAMTGLLWNSMMSMAGGWFFLTIVESFNLGGKPYRLPGIGSYMGAAIEAGDVRAMLAACTAMVLMIVLVDQFLWKPLLAWAERFKMDETGRAEKPRSFVYDLLRKSRIASWMRQRGRRRSRRVTKPAVQRPPDETPAAAPERARMAAWLATILYVALGIAMAGFVIWGGHRLVLLLARLAPGDWIDILLSIGLTGLRVLAVLVVGAAWAVPLGIWIGRSPRLSRLLQPVVQSLASFPMPMVFPVLAVWLAATGMNFGVAATILMMAGTQWYILFNVIAGATALPQDLREAAEVFRLRRLERFGLVDLPGAFPFLVTGLITAAGGAWNASIVSEWVSSGAGKILVAPGIGSLIAKAFNDRNDALLAASTLLLSLCLAVVNRFVWKPLYALADRRFALNR